MCSQGTGSRVLHHILGRSTVPGQGGDLHAQARQNRDEQIHGSRRAVASLALVATQDRRLRFQHRIDVLIVTEA
jgi:hypothetical protein